MLAFAGLTAVALVVLLVADARGIQPLRFVAKPLASAGFLITASVLMPGVASRIGPGSILIANALTAVAMTAFLRRAHFSAEAEQGAESNAESDLADVTGSPA